MSSRQYFSPHFTAQTNAEYSTVTQQSNTQTIKILSPFQISNDILHFTLDYYWDKLNKVAWRLWYHMSAEWTLRRQNPGSFLMLANAIPVTEYIVKTYTIIWKAKLESSPCLANSPRDCVQLWRNVRPSTDCIVKAFAHI